MRADLLEFVSACGFKTWANNDNPCFCCDVAKDQMHEFPPAMRLSKWTPRAAATYDEQVRQSLKHVHIEDDDVLQEVLSCLQWDAKHGGLAVPNGTRFPTLGLEPGDRLVQEGQVGDLYNLSSVSAPADLVFFQTKGFHGLNFIFPLFAVVGFTIECLALDVMHVLDLGVTQYLVGSVLWALIAGNFAKSEMATAELRRLENIKHLRRRMWAFYNANVRTRGEQSAIGRLTFKMLSSQTCPRLKAKAAESRNLLPLCLQLVQEGHDLGASGNCLVEATKALCAFYDTMWAEPRQMSAGGLDKLQKQMTRFLLFWKNWGGHMVYKHHCAWHMVERAAFLGNPRFYWTYADEGENRAMGTIAKSLHGGKTFYITFLQKALAEVC